MDVSIIIVSYNTKELLTKCLESIKVSTKNLKAEIFVVDNNSWDGTVKEIKKNFPSVKLVANKKNLGFAKANNLAIKKAKGKYLLILNPDTILMPDTLTKMKKFMDKNRNIAVATCRVELTNGQLDKDCRRHFPTPWRSFCHFTSLERLFPGSQVFDQYYMGYLPQTKTHDIDACVGAFMMVRSSSIKKVGLFDEDFFFYGEDLDWCWRFKEKGYKIVYTPITKIIHYKGVSSGIQKQSAHLSKASVDSKKKALQESTRAMELFYKKNFMERYPFFITWLTILAIKSLHLIRQIRLSK